MDNIYDATPDTLAFVSKIFRPIKENVTSISPLNESFYNFTNSSNLPLVHRQAIGLALALGGNLLISVSLSIQKKAHNRLNETNTNYCTDKWWWLGMVLMTLGESGNFLAYGFAPASLVAPLGSIGVLANVVIAVVFLGEPMTMPSMMGITLIVVGSFTLISFSVRGNPILTSEQIILYLEAWPFILYISIEVVILAILLYLRFARGKEHLVILLLSVAIIASITIITSKAVSTMLSETILEGKQHVFNAVFWISLVIIPISTISQIRFLNRAMQLYDISDVVPVNFMLFTTSAIIVGAVFYQEFYGVDFDRVFVFLFGVVQSIIGVYIITMQNEYESIGKDTTTEKFLSGSHKESPSNLKVENRHFSKYFHNPKHKNGATPANKTCLELTPYEGIGERKSLMEGTMLNNSSVVAGSSLLENLVSVIKSSEKISAVQPAVDNATLDR